MINQGSFIYKYFDETIVVNLKFGKYIYNLIPDFADFLDQTNETCLDYENWFFERLNFHKPLFYNPKVSEYKLFIDTKNKLLAHDVREDFFKNLDLAYKSEFDDAISFINMKGYQIMKVNQEVMNQIIPKYKNLEACFN